MAFSEMPVMAVSPWLMKKYKTIDLIVVGALCYVIGKIRSGWYDKYLSDLDALIDAVLDYMNK